MILNARSFSIAALAIVLSILPAAGQSAPPGFKDAFLGQLESSAAKLEALAEAMPAEAYGWSPGEGVMPVAQVYMHIAHYNYAYPQSGLGVAAPAGLDLEGMEGIAGKAQVVDQLRRSMRHVLESVRQMPESELDEATRLYDRDTAKWDVLFQLITHMNEHLGQSIAYARMNGVVPPWSR